MSRPPVEKFTCPVCGERCKGLISWEVFKGTTFYRYRRCEKCGIKFVTSERVAGVSQKNKRRRGE